MSLLVGILTQGFRCTNDANTDADLLITLQ